MINLIPNEEKKKMTRDFYLRLLSVFFVTLGFSFIITSVAIMPAFLLSSVKKDLAAQELASLHSVPIPALDQATLDTIDDLTRKLDLMESIQKDKFVVSEEVVNVILSKKTPSIKITKINYVNDPLDGRRVTINGNASSREALLLFRLALENDSSFKDVNLPISNFIRGTDIEFSLNLTPA